MIDDSVGLQTSMGGCGSSLALRMPNEKRFRRAIKLYEVAEVQSLASVLNRNRCSPLLRQIYTHEILFKQVCVDHSIDAARSLLRSGTGDRHGLKGGCYRRA